MWGTSGGHGFMGTHRAEMTPSCWSALEIPGEKENGERGEAHTCRCSLCPTAASTSEASQNLMPFLLLRRADWVSPMTADSGRCTRRQSDHAIAHL